MISSRKSLHVYTYVGQASKFYAITEHSDSTCLGSDMQNRDTISDSPLIVKSVPVSIFLRDK